MKANNRTARVGSAFAGPHARRKFYTRALIDTGSSQSFVSQSALDSMLACAATSSSGIMTPPTLGLGLVFIVHCCASIH